MASEPKTTNTLSSHNRIPASSQLPSIEGGIVDDQRAANTAQRKLQILADSAPAAISLRKKQEIANQSSRDGTVVQRMVLLGTRFAPDQAGDEQDANNTYVTTNWNDVRPPGSVPGGGQGDHTTPFTVLQHQIVNAVDGGSLNQAWNNLRLTLQLYQQLPGWAGTPAWVRTSATGVPDDPERQGVAGRLVEEGDIDDMQAVADDMLRIRNRMNLTSLPVGGHGNAEGTWAGALQHHERRLQLNNPLHANVNAVNMMGFMWKAFDHGRVNALGPAQQGPIRQQHAMTIVDAYPLLVERLGITVARLTNHYLQADWINHDPTNDQDPDAEEEAEGDEEGDEEVAEGDAADPVADEQGNGEGDEEGDEEVAEGDAADPLADEQGNGEGDEEVDGEGDLVDEENAEMSDI